MAAYTYSDWVGSSYGKQKATDTSEIKQKSLLGSLRKFFTKRKANSRKEPLKKVRKGLYMRSRSEEDITHGKPAFLRNLMVERSSFHHLSPYDNISPDAMFTQGAGDIGRRHKIANGPLRVPPVTSVDEDVDASPFDIPEYMNKQTRPSLQNIFDLQTKTDQNSRHPVPPRPGSRGPQPVRSKPGPVRSKPGPASLEPGHNPYPRTGISHSKQSSHSSDISTSSEANSERASRVRNAPVKRSASLGAGEYPGSEIRPAERRQRKIKALNPMDGYQEHNLEHSNPQQLPSKKRVHHKYRRKCEGSPHYMAPHPGMEMGPPFPSYMYPGYPPPGVPPPHLKGYPLVPGVPPNHMFPPYNAGSASRDYTPHYPLADDDRMEVESVPLNVIAEEKEEVNNTLPGAPHGFDDFSLY